MCNIKQIKELTEKFFSTYWRKTFGEQPNWSDPYPWEQWGNWERDEERPPFRQYPGCYALLRGNEIVYIGVGIRGSRQYPLHGIGYRLHDHKRRPKQCFGQITRICAIPFSEEHMFLSAALERFLIWNCQPVCNHQDRPFD